MNSFGESARKKRMMRQRRQQKQQQRLQLESLEHRICLTASVGWDGAGLGSATLTYTVGQAPAAVGQANFEAAVETALKVWSDTADITFVETNQTGLNDSIDFTFGQIDGSGGVLAQAYLPDDVNRGRIAGDVQFDSSESWEIGNAKGGHATDLVWVAVHEIGHALGLEHDNERGAVMAASVSPHASFHALDSADVDAVLQLYAASDSLPTGTLTPTSSVTPLPSGSGSTGSSFHPDEEVTDSTADSPGEDAGEDAADEENDTDQEPRRRRSPWSHGGWRRWRGWNRWNAWRSRWHQGSGNGDAGGDSADDAADTSLDESVSERTNPTRTTRISRTVRIWRVRR